MWTDEDIAAYEAREEHHDQRYEDGDYSTGTVADYEDWLDGWAEVLLPAPTTRRITRDEFDQLMEEEVVCA